jgi:hypothetical protein
MFDLTFVQFAAACVFTIVSVYIVIRVASTAYFNSAFDYMVKVCRHSVVTTTKKEEGDK